MNRWVRPRRFSKVGPDGEFPPRGVGDPGAVAHPGGTGGGGGLGVEGRVGRRWSASCGRCWRSGTAVRNPRLVLMRAVPRGMPAGPAFCSTRMLFSVAKGFAGSQVGSQRRQAPSDTRPCSAAVVAAKSHLADPTWPGSGCTADDLPDLEMERLRQVGQDTAGEFGVGARYRDGFRWQGAGQHLSGTPSVRHKREPRGGL